MITRIFLEHPRSVDESYVQHLFFAGWFSMKLFSAAAAALVHALLPCCFEKTASNIVVELYERTSNRGS